MSSPLNQAWPEDGLERVDACPYCGSHQRALAYKGVQDWSFNCAPGKWDYWDCSNCLSLYLDPRPTRSTIALAYARYYTHKNASGHSFAQAVKERLRNECLSLKLNSNIEPRLNLPKFANIPLGFITKRVVMPFGWTQLANLKKGRFIDVGCGAGQTVSLARQLGWDAMGLEIDPAAVREARRAGMSIIEGTYEQLIQYHNQFDCIMCSHVLEHVHEPRNLLTTLRASLRSGGVLLLTLPNSLSTLRAHFGANWRGLEAPRHFAIPSQDQLMRLLETSGFSIQDLADDGVETAAESYRIERRGLALTRGDIVKAHKLEIHPIEKAGANDFIKLVCEVRDNAC